VRLALAPPLGAFVGHDALDGFAGLGRGSAK